MALALIWNAEAPRGPQQEYTDYRVMSGQLQIGRIYQREPAGRLEVRWLWAINGVIAGKEVMRRAGMTATFEEAQAVSEGHVRWQSKSSGSSWSRNRDLSAADVCWPCCAIGAVRAARRITGQSCFGI